MGIKIRFIIVAVYTAFCSCLLFDDVSAIASTMYISESLRVSARSEPTTQSSVVGVEQTGSQVEVINQKEEWSYVRLSNGKEGWILTKLLCSDPPSSAVIQQLKLENENMAMDLKNLKDENTQFKQLLNEKDETLKRLKENIASSQNKQGVQPGDDTIHPHPLTFFMSGALVLFAGIIIGYSAKRKKRGGLFIC
ncbi:MAG: TIGR04211 family SH3 domain-containing protein [Pseudomonadota bacterium]